MTKGRITFVCSDSRDYVRGKCPWSKYLLKSKKRVGYWAYESKSDKKLVEEMDA